MENESLSHTVNFGIGSAFSKGPKSAFSEGPGPGPLYKVCLQYLGLNKGDKVCECYSCLKLMMQSTCSSCYARLFKTCIT